MCCPTTLIDHYFLGRHDADDEAIGRPPGASVVPQMGLRRGGACRRNVIPPAGLSPAKDWRALLLQAYGIPRWVICVARDFATPDPLFLRSRFDGSESQGGQRTACAQLSAFCAFLCHYLHVDA